MDKTINLRFKYTQAEYVAATRLYLMRSSNFLIRIAVCFLYAIVCISIFAWLEIFNSEILLLFGIVLCIPFVIAFLHLFVLSRRRFRSDPKFQEEYFLQFSDDGVHFKTAQVDALLQWSLYEKVLEDDRFYLLIYDKNMISVIPKRAFSSADQERSFSELLRRNVPAYSNNKRLKGRSSNVWHSSYVPPAEPPDWR